MWAVQGFSENNMHCIAGSTPGTKQPYRYRYKVQKTDGFASSSHRRSCLSWPWSTSKGPLMPKLASAKIKVIYSVFLLVTLQPKYADIGQLQTRLWILNFCTPPFGDQLTSRSRRRPLTGWMREIMSLFWPLWWLSGSIQSNLLHPVNLSKWPTVASHGVTYLHSTTTITITSAIICLWVNN